MDFKTQKQFDKLDEKEQYKYISSISNYGVMVLDNDSTYFRLNDESLDLSYSMKCDCGDRKGTIIILELLGIESEHC